MSSGIFKLLNPVKCIMTPKYLRTQAKIRQIHNTLIAGLFAGVVIAWVINKFSIPNVQVYSFIENWCILFLGVAGLIILYYTGLMLVNLRFTWPNQEEKFSFTVNSLNICLP